MVCGCNLSFVVNDEKRVWSIIHQGFHETQSGALPIQDMGCSYCILDGAVDGAGACLDVYIFQSHLL